MGVFKVNRDFTIIINPEAAKLVPELCSLTQDELRYVILVADYVDGPYRKKPYEERQRIAKTKVFDSAKKDIETKKVKLALNAYKSLVFDIRRETIDNYNKKISSLNKQLFRTEDPKVIKSLDSSIDFLQDRIVSINHSLNISEEESIEIKGNKKLSMLEIWQRNMKAFKEHNTEDE